MFIPYANFPTDYDLNIFEDNPKLFKKVDFKNFLLDLPSDKQAAFMSSGMFLQASLYQENSMTSLIMLLSAVERTVSPSHRPLESQLVSKNFRAKIETAPDGKSAYAILRAEVVAHTNAYGSRKTIVGFYTDNLTNLQKLRLIRGIKLVHKYKKSTPPHGKLLKSDKYGKLVALFTPIPESNPTLRSDDTEAIDEELRKRIKAVIYDIRNGFVHRSQSNPFGNESYIKKNNVYRYEKYEQGDIKELWLITMTFRQLHALTHIAYQNYWIKEAKKHNIKTNTTKKSSRT